MAAVTSAPTQGTLHRLMRSFDAAFTALGHAVPGLVVEHLASVVHNCMSDQGRIYHRTNHVFDLFTDATTQPITALAAMFHDTVYTQVDGGLPPIVKSALESLVVWNKAAGEFRVMEHIEPHFAMASHIFGFAPGHHLGPFAGLNEYLSCLVAMHELHSHCTAEELLEIAICIEATVPFRKPDAQGLTWCDRLYNRAWDWAAIRCTPALAVDAHRLQTAIQRAVCMANLDVGGFSSKDTMFFLVNTWNLLPEGNITLRMPGLYSLKDYRTSLHKTTKFFHSLQPSSIYHQYHGVPDNDEYAARLQCAELNLSISILYLKYKLIAAGILEALADCTGGDGPISMFLGDLTDGLRLDHFLPR